ncbi:hypothetical protein D1007_52308 [Hordeum vulgare]|nr:hypothetical protein D1007_52308 [Hordeum vulgare]
MNYLLELIMNLPNIPTIVSFAPLLPINTRSTVRTPYSRSADFDTDNVPIPPIIVDVFVFLASLHSLLPFRPCHPPDPPPAVMAPKTRASKESGKEVEKLGKAELAQMRGDNAIFPPTLEVAEQVLLLVPCGDEGSRHRRGVAREEDP